MQHKNNQSNILIVPVYDDRKNEKLSKIRSEGCAASAAPGSYGVMTMEISVYCC